MSAGPYSLETYGIARRESPQACAVRLGQMLKSLAAIHPAFRRWNKQGYSEAQAQVSFCSMPPNVDKLASILEEGCSYADVDKKLLPELGYLVGAWNGMDGGLGVSMRLTVGSFWDRPAFPNQTDFEFESLESGNANLLNAKVLRAVLLAIVGAWEPNWASLTSSDYSKKFFATLPPPLFRSGWMTYLSAPYAHKITIPLSAIAEPVVGGGILMLTTSEPFSVDNPQHVAVADAIQACLEPLQSDPGLARP